MNTGPVDKLTEGQRDCLRRVLMHQTSKDIARELRISPHTVDQRLRVAARTLGVATRIEAARALARFENIDTDDYQSAVYQPSVVASDMSERFVHSTAAGDRHTVGHGQSEYARERQLTYQAFVPEAHKAITPPIPLHAGDENQFGIWQRLRWIVAIAILTTLAFGALLAGLGSLGTLLRGGSTTYVSDGVPRSRH